MATTMKDVARQAGVDVSTVSLAINNDPRIRVETRERILRIAGDLSYRKNLLARGLRSGRSFTVGAIVDAGSPFGHEVLIGAHSILGPRDYHLLLDYLCDGPVCGAARQIEALKSKRIDGLLIAPGDNADARDADRTTCASAYDALRSDDIPFVFVGRRVPGVDGDLVAIDNTAAVEDAVAYLRCLGHQRIGYVFEPCRMNSTESERLHAYEFAMRTAGAMSICLPVQQYPETSASVGGHASISETLRRARLAEVTALIVANDALAFCVMRALDDAGLTAPRDLSVIAIGGSPQTEQIRPSLTTVTLPTLPLGAAAASLLYGRIQGDHSPRREIRLQAELTLRSSCAAPINQRRNTMPAGRNTG